MARSPLWGRDPIRRTIPKSTEELVRRFAAAADGAPADIVIGAGMTMILNALRMTHRNRSKVEARYNDITGQAKQLLLDHYDGVSGKRKEQIALVLPDGRPIKVGGTQ